MRRLPSCVAVEHGAALLEQIEQRGRDGRQRFGFAVDALGIDASKAKDEVRAAPTNLEGVPPKKAKQAAKFMLAHREVVTWEGRSGFQEPYEELAQAYRATAAAMDVWLAARTRSAPSRRGRGAGAHR